MNDRVAKAAAELDAVAAPLGLRRLEALGEELSGAYNFYATRLRRGTILGPYDLGLARALLDWPEAPRRIHEIGGGFGNFCILLALLGFKTTSLEADSRRFAAANALQDALNAEFPQVRDGYEIINQRFPLARGLLPPAGAMVVATNLVSTTSTEARARILAAVRAYDCAIVDVDRFLVHCTTPEQRAERLETLAAAGLYGELFLDLGKNACFYRFVRS